MIALFESFVLFALVAVLFGRGDIKRILIILSVLAMPMKIDYAFYSGSNGNWTSVLSVSLSDLVLLALAMRSKADPWDWGRLWDSPLSKAFGFMAIAGVISMINSTTRPTTALQVMMMIQLLVINYMTIRMAVRSEEDVRSFLFGTQLLMAIQGGIGVMQFGLNNNFMLFETGDSAAQDAVVGDEDEGNVLLRVVGSVGRPNGYGMLMCWLALLNLTMIRGRALVTGLFPRIAILLAAAGMLLSFSRGSWLGFVLGGFLMLIMIARKTGQVMRVIFGSLSIAALVGLAALPLIMQRLTSDDKNAAYSRVPLVDIAFEMIKANPIVGIGANTYRNVMYQYLPSNFEQKYVDQVHNHYLLVTAEMGVFGLIAWLMILRAYFTIAKRCRSEPGRYMNTAWVFGLAISVIGLEIVVHSFVEPFNARLHTGFMLMFAAMAESMSRPDFEWTSVPEEQEEEDHDQQAA